MTDDPKSTDSSLISADSSPSPAPVTTRGRRRRPTAPFPVPHFPPRDAGEATFGLRDPWTGTHWLLPHTASFVIGSGTTADVIVDRELVSRRHCTVERRGAWLHFKDHSKNGSFLHDQRLEEFDIAPGDQLRLATTELTVATAPMLAAADALATYLGLRAHRQVDRALRLGATASAIVLVGEDGTGHEVVANLLHGCSRHRARPLVHPRSPAELRAALRLETGTVLLSTDDFATPLDAKVAEELNARTNVGTLGVYVKARSNEEVVEHLRIRTSDHDVIHLAPLRFRRDEIPDLLDRLFARSRWSTWLDSQRLGTRALAKLARRDWPGNLPQLTEVAGHLLVLFAHGGDVKSSATVLGVQPSILRRLAKDLGLSFPPAKPSAARSVVKRRRHRTSRTI